MIKEYTHCNHIKATSKRAQNDARISPAERRQQLRQEGDMGRYLL